MEPVTHIDGAVRPTGWRTPPAVVIGPVMANIPASGAAMNTVQGPATLTGAQGRRVADVVSSVLRAVISDVWPCEVVAIARLIAQDTVGKTYASPRPKVASAAAAPKGVARPIRRDAKGGDTVLVPSSVPKVVTWLRLIPKIANPCHRPADLAPLGAGPCVTGQTCVGAPRAPAASLRVDRVVGGPNYQTIAAPPNW